MTSSPGDRTRRHEVRTLPIGEPVPSPQGSFQNSGPLTLWRPPRHGEWPWLEALVTTRRGGSSQGPYAELNLGLSTGDEPGTVESNRALLRQVLGLGDPSWHRMHQVHGDRIVPAGAEAEPEADGQWTQEPGRVLVVGVADCVPVFLWDARGRRLALVHAGWRGTALGVVARAVESLRQAGAHAADLWMSMGPSIGPCCYEVGPDVADRFPNAAVRREPARPHLDLRQANRLVAQAAGVGGERILGDPPCTACGSANFFSHRRLGPRTGRMWAAAWIRDDAT
jgi:purine-nucleoside/S-methyl-5'-thioadenosine phosphorylase / adenosine deaminase